MKLIIISVGVTMQLRLCPAAAQMLAAINNLDVGSTKKERWRNQKEAENAHFLFFHANKEQFQLLKTCRLKQPLWNIIYFQHTHTHWPASPLSMFCSILTHTHTQQRRGSVLFHGDRGSYFLLWSSPLPLWSFTLLCFHTENTDKGERERASFQRLPSRLVGRTVTEAWNHFFGPWDTQAHTLSHQVAGWQTVKNIKLNTRCEKAAHFAPDMLVITQDEPSAF